MNVLAIITIIYFNLEIIPSLKLDHLLEKYRQIQYEVSSAS